MTKEQVIELAKQAGFQKFLKPADRPEMICDPAALERFATLVGNAKLEEAAQKCMEEVADLHSSNESRNTAETLARRIESLKEPTP